MKSQCRIEVEADGCVLYQGEFGAARVAKRKVYFFEPGESRADEVWTRRSNADATCCALEWVVKGAI